MSDRPASGAAPVVRLADVKRRFFDGTRTREVLNGVDLEVKAGELIAIIGASGSGKTTLLNVVGALDAGFEGGATIFGQELRGLGDDQRAVLRNREVGFVFQSFHLLDHLSVIENVKLPLWLSSTRAPDPEEDARAKDALVSVGLGERLHDRVGPLSGGERQRIAIARAIVNRPRLVLADEPTGNLDTTTGGSVFGLFDAIRKRTDRGGCAVIVVTHDPRVAGRADRVLELEGGRLHPRSAA